MTERDTFTTIDDGDQLNDGYFNGIQKPLSDFDATDNTRQEGDSASYATKRTIAIAAGAVVNYVLVRFDLEAYGTHGGTDGSYTSIAYAQVTIDSVQKFEASVTCPYIIRDQSGTSNTRVAVFKYTPSTAEKAAGFTIDLDLKQVGTCSAPTSYNHYWEVWGA